MDNGDRNKLQSRFATIEEITSESFMALNRELDRITVEYKLPDHSDLNQNRYPWAVPMLSVPALYGSRMWEYPFALIAADLRPGMKCVDVGCGMTAFTIYLKEVEKCQVIGTDPDFFATGTRYKGYGISGEFVLRTGIRVIQSRMESIPLTSNTFDRVFCLSVIEHLDAQSARHGIQEMARVLKPGGRLIITVDVDLETEFPRPLDLIWDSGLLPLGDINLQWPRKRLGLRDDGKRPADVYGFVLGKDSYQVERDFSVNPRIIYGWEVPALRDRIGTSLPKTIAQRMRSRLRDVLSLLLESLLGSARMIRYYFWRGNRTRA